jgi:hypothetical protein
LQNRQYSWAFFEYSSPVHESAAHVSNPVRVAKVSSDRINSEADRHTVPPETTVRTSTMFCGKWLRNFLKRQGNVN